MSKRVSKSCLRAQNLRIQTNQDCLQSSSRKESVTSWTVRILPLRRKSAKNARSHHWNLNCSVYQTKPDKHFQTGHTGLRTNSSSPMFPPFPACARCSIRNMTVMRNVQVLRTFGKCRELQNVLTHSLLRNVLLDRRWRWKQACEPQRSVASKPDAGAGAEARKEEK